MKKHKLIRITTIPISLEKLLENQLRFMKKHYAVTAISADRNALERVGEVQEVSVFHVKMTRKITPWKDLKAVWRLYWFFIKEKPFIVHTHTPKAGTVGMLAAKLAGVPLRLHTIAGLPLLETKGNKRKLLNVVEKVTYSCATNIYPNSKGLYDIILKHRFVSSSKLRVLANGSSNGIDSAHFNAENFTDKQNQILKIDLGIDSDNVVFIFVGRLVGDKGINELVTAFKRLASEMPNAKLILVGNFESHLDPLASETKQEITDNPNIIYVGYQKDVRPYYAISNCLVFPSYREGFPNVVLQAGAMGLPSIVSNINGCNEIIVEGENGTIIPVKSSEAVYKAMKKMVSDFGFRIQLSQNAREMIVSRYERLIVLEAILSEYRTLEKKLKQPIASPRQDSCTSIIDNQRKSVGTSKKKIIRTSTIALSLNYLLKGQLHFLQQHYQVVAVSGADEHLLQVAEREKVATISVGMERKISPLQDIRTLFQLYFLFRKEKPLIVHSITPKAGLLTMMAGYLAGVPIRIHTFTGLIFPTRKGIMQKLLIFTDRILCYCATNIYPEGQGVKSDLISYKITTKKLQVLANGNVNGTDTMYFDSDLISTAEKQQLKTNLGIAADDFVFIFIGRLVGDKGINELIQAFQQLCGESAAVKLLLVGPFEADFDPLRPETLQLINSNQQILSVGFQQDVRPYFAISDCLAFPSHREGFPNVVLQAGAMSLPSIVTNISGCNEIIREGQNGVIIPVNDSSALYKAMKKIVTDDAFRLQLEQNARRMIVSRYEQQVVWDAILAEYKALEQQAGY